MNTNELVEWQKIDESNGLVYPWWTHPFLDVLNTWNLKDVQWLEFGGGRSSAWLRSKCKWVDTIEANSQWALQSINDCDNAGLINGFISYKDLPDGIQELKQEYFDLINNPNRPTVGDRKLMYDIISVDGIWRNECLQWALDHFKGRGGIIVVDNMDQDFVWISPAADELMKPYECHKFIQPNHINHEGKPWNTRYYVIPA